MDYLLTLLLLSLISSLVGFGFHIMLNPYMIFNGYYELLVKLANKNRFLYYLTKPLGRCIICNTTWIGMIITQIVINEYTWLQLFNLIIVGVSSAALVCLISNYYHKLQNSI